MSRLEELIDLLCPNGVRFCRLSDVAIVSIGEFVHKSLQNDSDPYPVYNGGISNTGFYSEYNRTEDKIIISARGANAGFVNKVQTKFWSGNSCYTIEVNDKKVNWVFLYYWLKNNESKLLGGQQKGGIPAVSKRQVEEFPVPIPPIVIQEEIVCILERFTKKVEALQERLYEEIDARREQYKYYRDILIKNAKEAEFVSVQDIAKEIYRGAGIKRDQITQDGIPCVRYGEIYTTYEISFNECISHTKEEFVVSPKYFEYGDILFAITGESIEEIAKSIVYLGNERCLAGGDIVVLKHNQDPRYISYALSTNDAMMQKSKGKVKSKVVHSSVPAIKEIKIPLPAIEEQKRIAFLLDDFRRNVEDILKCFEKEIQVRQKQYEYYRDKLLSFKERTI